MTTALMIIDVQQGILANLVDGGQQVVIDRELEAVAARLGRLNSLRRRLAYRSSSFSTTGTQGTASKLGRRAGSCARRCPRSRTPSSFASGAAMPSTTPI